MPQARHSHPARDYPALRRIDGRHPYKKRIPGGCVEYRVRRRPGGRVAYFNFALAREMGLIPADHPDRLNPRLRRALTDTFGLMIINEYDQMHGPPVPEREIRPHTYMATRYLQLQHADRRGTTSGDGRSIWNGTVRHRGRTWDVSSCGTGVTRLCPATAEQNRFFKTGSDEASYGCGTACLDEGLEAVLMSEIFHRNGIPTERSLAILTFPDGFAINVRAGLNLLRPSHLLVHLKQGNLEALDAAVDCFVERQAGNGLFPHLTDRRRRLEHFAREMARTFGRTAALFESEYIFCWLDWDGDNILADGGIIDYGSVRQLGLYHREYRFDDGPRFSTTLPQQRRKARLIVQNCAQIRDFLLTGRKPPLRSLSRDPVLRLFDQEFTTTRLRRLLRSMGLPVDLQGVLLAQEAVAVARFRRVHAYFEGARSARGPVKVPDGFNWNVIFSTRDLLRELPRRYLADPSPIPAAEFMEIALTSYATPEDQALTPYRRRQIRRFQSAYMDLMRAAAAHARADLADVLSLAAERSARINRYARITGDSVSHMVQVLMARRRRLSSRMFHRVMERFIREQVLDPDRDPGGGAPPVRGPEARRLLKGLTTVMEEYREGL